MSECCTTKKMLKMKAKNYLFKDLVSSLQYSLLLSNFVYFSQGMYICLHTPLYIGGVDSRLPNILYTVDSIPFNIKGE